MFLHRLEVHKASAIPLIHLGIDVVSRIIMKIGHRQIMLAANRERLPIKSPIGGNRLKLDKGRAIPLIEFGINIMGRIVMIIGHGEVVLAANREEVPA